MLGASMKSSALLLIVLVTALPLAGGALYTVDPTLTTPTIAGVYIAGQTLSITVTGTVNLLGLSDGSWITNPDGSLVTPLADCPGCWNHMYQYANSGFPYPTVNGQGDGINHFVGGGANYDMFPSTPNSWAPEGKQTTDTTDPGALRFGALAYTFVANPTATDWMLLGYGGIISTGAGGTLQLIVVDTASENNTGGYTANINIVTLPEPSTALFAFSGAALLALTHCLRRFRADVR
jgi:hypothetical protein